MNKIATLTNKPVIDFSQLEEIGKGIKADLSRYDFANMVVTEDNVKAMKTLRAKLNKDFKLAEDVRKSLKSEVNDPYEQFLSVYKENIEKPYKSGIDQLALSIKQVEDDMKKQKEDEVELYFNELVSQRELSFLKFNQLELKVLLSTTLPSLKLEVDDFVNRVVSDLTLIGTQTHKERILTQYEQTLNVSEAIVSVTQAMEREQELAKPKAVEPVKEVIVEDEFEMEFTVIASLSKLKLLKQFMMDNQIKLKGELK